MSKKYNPLKEVRTTVGMLSTEAVGYGVAGKLAGLDSTGMASKAFGIGSSLAGVPSLTYAGGSVIRSLEMLDYGKKNKKK